MHGISWQNVSMMAATIKPVGDSGSSEKSSEAVSFFDFGSKLMGG